MENPIKRPGEKLFPRNLTARADYVVRGNPVVSRPESGADNSHPGLEFDQRNLDRGFFPGLLFDFQFGVGARLVDVQSPWPGKAREKDSKHGFDAKEGEFFLWYVYGRFGNQPDTLTFVDLYGLDGYDVLRKVHDLEPGPLIIVVGLPPEKLNLKKKGKAWLGAAILLKDKLKLLEDDTLGQQIETFRDEHGKLQFAILSGHRARYLNADGVIDLQTAEPGVLTRSLCSPWQWDFADCGCYYWAASRPDIVTSASGEQGLNFLRVGREEPSPPDAALTWATWMDQTRIMSQPQMILGWETLPLVIGDQEAETYQPKLVQPVGSPWNRATVITQLKHLAAVEHTLSVKFLYAHYSVNAPADAAHKPDDPADPMLTTVAKEIFKVAIDEMRHFRWVNEALIKLGKKPVFSRANKLSKPPGRSKFRQQQTDLVLEGLTPESMNRFIEIEKPSQQYGPDEIAGLYTHILISLDQHPDRYKEYSDDEREQLQEVCKLIIDEGADHWRRAVRVQELLRGHDPKDYLRFTGGPIRQPPESECGKLQILGDHYYRLMLDALRLAFAQPPDARGHLIRQARRVMHNLHEVGHLLAARGQGLLFTPPRTSRSGGPSPGGPSPSGPSPGGPSAGGPSSGSVPHALATSVPRLLTTLSASESAELAEVARRHGQTMSELLSLFTNGAEGNDL